MAIPSEITRFAIWYRKSLDVEWSFWGFVRDVLARDREMDYLRKMKWSRASTVVALSGIRRRNENEAS